MVVGTADELEIVEMRGVKAPVDPTVMSPTLVNAIRTGEYERAEAKKLPKMVEPGDRLLELGAGMGYLSSIAAMTAPLEKIVVVEANPALIPIIHKTHALNGVVAEVIHAAVVGEKTSDTVRFIVDEDFWASSIGTRKNQDVRELVDVPTASVADLIREHAPTFLIIDIEGGETDILPHLDLSTCRMVLMELHFKEIGPHGIAAVFDCFARQGFYYDHRFSMGGVVVFNRLP
jgi:FkbM family methyltransferase